MTCRRQVFGKVQGKVAACIAGLAETYLDIDDSTQALEPWLHALRQKIAMAA